MQHNIRSAIASVSQNKRVRAIALEVMGGKASVKISGSSQCLYGLPITGGNIIAGQEVFVDYTTGTPVVHSYEEQASSSYVSRVSTRKITTDPDIPASAPIGEAPLDGKTYGRNSASWIEVTSSGSTPTSGSDCVEEAPLDGLLYVRSSGSWQEHDHEYIDIDLARLANTSGNNSGDQVGDGVTITGAGTIADPFVASGSGVSGVNFSGVYNELITGVGTTFTTANIYVADSLRVYLNGVRQDDSQFTENVTCDGFTTSFTTGSEDILCVDYNTFILEGIMVSTGLSATSGSEIELDGYKLHVFTSSGSITINETGLYEVFMLAGGGGGGGPSPDGVAGGGGAGAGTLLVGYMYIQEGIYPVVVGEGGIGGNVGNIGTTGSDTTFNGTTAKGGGSGRDADSSPYTLSNGGCSGGASGSSGDVAGLSIQSQYDSQYLLVFTGLGGTKNDGNAGSFAGGAGGSAGTNAIGRTPGAGKMSTFSGTAVTYARGGYGQGTSNNIQAGVDGNPNTGDGGNGAGKGTGNTGGDGGSGLFMLKYISTPSVIEGAPADGIVTSGSVIDGHVLVYSGSSGLSVRDGGRGVIILGSSGSQITVANSTSETTVYSGPTLPGGHMDVNASLRFTVLFDLRHDTACTTTLKIKLGSSVIFTFGFPHGVTDPIKPSRMEVVVANLGASNSQKYFYKIDYTDGSYKQYFGSGTGSADTSIDQQLTMTIQHSVANANNYYKQYSFLAELCKGE
jgi:hypothetical protein